VIKVIFLGEAQRERERVREKARTEEIIFLKNDDAAFQISSLFEKPPLQTLVERHSSLCIYMISGGEGREHSDI